MTTTRAKTATPRATLRPLGEPMSEQRMLLHGVSWDEYVLLRDALDRPGLRMTYCEGVLELTSPSRNHELWKKTAARLIEIYAFVRGLPLLGYGSTTFKKKAEERGAEPDECWCVGVQMGNDEFPHIVLEVIASAPLLDKLDVYDGFGIPEVWVWRDGAFALYRRHPEGGYDPIQRSVFLPELDFELLAPFVTRVDQDVAVREFAEIVRGSL